MVSTLCCGFKKSFGSSHVSNPDGGCPSQGEHPISNPVQCTEEHDVEQETKIPITPTKGKTRAPIQCTEGTSTGKEFQGKVSVEVSVVAGDKELKVKTKVRFPEKSNGMERMGNDAI
ncbi:uncharacterized protein LOC141886652 isoform X1 [Acropora palmata]|uniref:uncharacterized protein LOC141886652 isoform X1 n=1 Tax=Acropora palmata TaxID=6131 RepID=UPI003DA0A1B8